MKIILYLILAYIFYALIKKLFVKAPRSAGSAQSSSRKESSHTVDVETAKDPVCGAYVSKNTALAAKDGANTLYFCSSDCRDKFIAGR